MSVEGEVTSDQVVQWSVIRRTSYCFCQGQYEGKDIQGCDREKKNFFISLCCCDSPLSWLLWLKGWNFLLKNFLKLKEKKLFWDP